MMKKQIAFLFTALCLLCGCGAATSEPAADSVQALQQQLDQVTAERDALQSQLDALAGPDGQNADASQTVTVSVTGTFTATVRDLIPNYVLDGSTPMMAVITTFQSEPFILNTRDKTNSLTVGETYVFTVESAEKEITKEEYQEGVPFPPARVEALYGLEVLSVAPAGEGDAGLDLVHLEFTQAR